jgi:hypothetical protein
VRVWVEDVQFQLARALRTVGIALGAVAWTSVLASQAQQNSDVRAYAVVAAAIVGVLAGQWFNRLPPSATVVELLRPFERDIITAARDRAGDDPERLQFLAARIATLAAVRIRRGGTVPRDRRAWFRTLARLAGDRRQAAIEPFQE